MRNPLSYHGNDVLFYGFEINEWCRDQVNRGTTRAREARRLLRKHYRDDRIYVTDWCSRDSGSGAPMMMVFRRYKES